MDRLQGEGD
jgi:DNA-binding phage protein